MNITFCDMCGKKGEGLDYRFARVKTEQVLPDCVAEHYYDVYDVCEECLEELKKILERGRAKHSE